MSALYQSEVIGEVTVELNEEFIQAVLSESLEDLHSGHGEVLHRLTAANAAWKDQPMYIYREIAIPHLA